MLAFVFVTLSSQARRKAFLAAVGRNASILECHHVAGDDDYLLKVRCQTMGDLDRAVERRPEGPDGRGADAHDGRPRQRQGDLRHSPSFRHERQLHGAMPELRASAYAPRYGGPP